MSIKRILNLKDFFSVWLPLLGSWWMMALEGPFLTSLTARLENPKLNLAAFGVAFSLAWLFESPIVMMMTASLRLVKNRQNFLFLRKFNYALCILITFIFALALTPMGWNVLSKTLLNLNDDVASIAWKAMIILLPWPAFIGYRRFYQGILISFGKSKYLLYGTVVRVVAMLVFAYIGSQISVLDGIQQVTLALSGGVFVEAIAARILVKPFIKELVQKDSLDNLISLKDVTSFYIPLAMTAMMSIAVQPLITASVNYGSFALQSLAALPVINAFIFIFKCFPLSLQEAYISLIEKNDKNMNRLSFYTRMIILTMSVTLLLIVFTPLYSLWFININGLSPDLIAFARASLAVVIWQPIISVFHSFNRSIAIHHKKTKFISNATLLELSLIVLTLITVIPMKIFSGIFSAMVALLIGRVVSALYLYIKIRKM